MTEAEAKYRAALRREKRVRDAAYVDVTERLWHCQALPLTFRHWLVLDLVGSPFASGAIPTAEDVFAFLWLVSPCYDKTDARTKRKLLRMCRAFMPPRFALWRKKVSAQRTIELVKVCEEIRKYIDEAFMDAPAVRGDGDGHETSYYSNATASVHMLASSYGWSLNECLDLPLKVLFQHLKAIRAEESAKRGKRAVMFNPSDREMIDMVQANATAQN